MIMYLVSIITEFPCYSMLLSLEDQDRGIAAL